MKPSNLLRIAVNGHDWPEVSALFSGTADLKGAVDLFMAKALAVAVHIRQLAEGGS